MKKFFLCVAAWNFLVMLINIWVVIPMAPAAAIYITPYSQTFPIILPLILWYLTPPRGTGIHWTDKAAEVVIRSFKLFVVLFYGSIAVGLIGVKCGFIQVSQETRAKGYPTEEHYRYLGTETCQQYGGFRI